MNKDINTNEYIRVGTQYYRVAQQPSINGEH